MNLRKRPSRKPLNNKLPKADGLVTQHAAECVEELLNATKEQGPPWFLIIERKMKRLISKLRRK